MADLEIGGSNGDSGGIVCCLAYLGLEGALPFSLSLKGVIRFLGPALDPPPPHTPWKERDFQNPNSKAIYHGRWHRLPTRCASIKLTDRRIGCSFL